MFKNFSIIVFTLILSVALSGCQLKKTVEEKVDYTGVELTFYKVFDDADIIEPIINQYEADHHGLKINYRKFNDFDEYVDLVLNEMAEGEGPDIFSMQNTWFASNLKKLSPMPREFGSPQDFANTFVDVAYKDLVRVDENGREGVYALPMSVDTLALYYNKDHFEDRIPSRGKPASTWEGIKEDVSLLNKEDNSFSRFEVSGIALGRVDNISRAVDILYLLLLQHGAEFYNENMSEAIFAGRQDGVGDYPGFSALELFIGFADETQKQFSWNEFIADSDGQEVEAFARGDVSMIIGYPFTYEQILNQINLLNTNGIATIDKDVVKISQIPQLYDPNVSNEKRVTYASYFAEGVSRNSEHSDIAWDFLIFLTSRENQDYYFDKLHKPSGRRDMIEGQKQTPIYGVFASQVGYAESFPIVDFSTYKSIFEDVITLANLEGASRKPLVDAQDLITELLPDGGYIVPISDEEIESDE